MSSHRSVLILLALLLLSAGYVAGGSVNWYANTDTSCATSLGSGSGINTNGGCQSFSSGTSGTFYYSVACTGGTANVTYYGSSTTCATPTAQGSGTGNGNTCFPLNFAGTAVVNVKVNCNAGTRIRDTLFISSTYVIILMAAILMILSNA